MAFQVAKAGACTLPAWSPDGQRLAFDFRGRPWEVWVIDTADLPVLVSELPLLAPRPTPALVPATAARLPSPAPAVEAQLKVGDPAPALQVSAWVQGDPVETFEPGKVYLVEFWATWCGPCITAIPHVNALHEKYKDQGLVVIGQNVWEHQENQVEPFVRKMGERMTYPTP